MTYYADSIQKLMNNFKTCFYNFVLGGQLLLITQNPFLVTNVTKFSEEAKEIFRWANIASMELIELQENVALKEQVGNCDPAIFWGKVVPAADFPVLKEMLLCVCTIQQYYLHIYNEITRIIFTNIA